MTPKSEKEYQNTPLTVHTLIGAGQVEIGLKCLSSLSQQIDREVRFVVHDDGSLDDSDTHNLKSELPVGRIIGRREADEKVLEKIRSYPRCRKYRNRSNMALKLFDVPLLSSGNVVSYSDSDIFYKEPVRGVFEVGRGDAIFSSNGHMGNAYALSFKQVKPIGRLRIVDSLNAGLYTVKSSCYDLSFIENVLCYLSESHRYWERPYWVEQTCWSALAARIDAKLWSFDDITIPRKRRDGHIDVPEDALIVHFASSVRDALWETDVRTDDEPSKPRLTDPSYNTSLKQLKFDAGIYLDSVLTHLGFS